MIFTFSVDETYSVGLARFKRSFRYRIYLNRTKTQRFQMINNTKLREVNVNTAYFPILARINMSVNVVNLSKKEHLSSNSLIKRSGKRKKKARVKITISYSITLRHRLAIISFSSHVLIIQNGRRSAQIQKPGLKPALH